MAGVVLGAGVGWWVVKWETLSSMKGDWLKVNLIESIQISMFNDRAAWLAMLLLKLVSLEVDSLTVSLEVDCAAMLRGHRVLVESRSRKK